MVEHLHSMLKDLGLITSIMKENYKTKHYKVKYQNIWKQLEYIMISKGTKIIFFK